MFVLEGLDDGESESKSESSENDCLRFTVFSRADGALFEADAAVVVAIVTVASPTDSLLLLEY